MPKPKAVVPPVVDPAPNPVVPPVVEPPPPPNKLEPVLPNVEPENDSLGYHYRTTDPRCYLQSNIHSSKTDYNLLHNN